jgi:hypothetical protein
MKTLIGLFTALLMAAGLVAVSSPPASAACNSYSGCVKTTTKASAPSKVSKRRKATVCGSVKAVSSNATPRGNLRFTVTRNGGKYSFARTIPYGGGKMCVVTTKLRKPGRYTVRVAYLPQKNSIFNASSDSAGFKVKSR